MKSITAGSKCCRLTTIVRIDDIWIYIREKHSAGVGGVPTCHDIRIGGSR